jgi:hypothetical protein
MLHYPDVALQGLPSAVPEGSEVNGSTAMEPASSNGPQGGGSSGVGGNWSWQSFGRCAHIRAAEYSASSQSVLETLMQLLVLTMPCGTLGAVTCHPATLSAC